VGARPRERASDRFNRYAAMLTTALGSLWALIASVLLVVVWALTGPIFNFSDTWQLFINTTTTVVTFWMVFVIQNSANRDQKALHLKLDELLRVHEHARNELINLEQAPEDVIAKTAQELAEVAQKNRGTGIAEIRVERVDDGPDPGEPEAAEGVVREVSPDSAGTTRAAGDPAAPRATPPADAPRPPEGA
jgi:low affinity Fe/Cu permease